jgi:hypothetical protein
LVTKVARSAWEEQAAKIAIEKELRQLIEELVAIVPVKRTSIPADVTILKSHMLLVNKYMAGGSFDEVKGGSLQTVETRMQSCIQTNRHQR